MASLSFTKSAIPRGKDEVYVVAVPLRATKGPAQALVFDFQPKDPENLYVALDVISGRAVPGVLHMRKLRKVPRSKCWYVGSPEVDAVDIACEFNKSWETDLRVGRHDCRDYTNGLVEYLTGQKDVLEHLRRSTGGLG
ncbi:hypothetical protein FH972_014276 [Carpinus fangiana]|uniref:Uncharacterized protein n=1 Tax=Carpinus fangiana TaxID=176857 RepID=A0A5N6R9G6_9ROSI|nr:hypothetical protein FH972_014276 [Carpinus fangiana]